LVNAMKNSRVSPFLAFSLPVLACALTALSASAVRAAECPASSPDQDKERRALAKEWFARAEAAENAGNDVEAVHAYACSMKMVAHAFTAFNLARVAERSGDAELALKSYQAYLTLKADATDKDEIQAKIQDLEAKIKEVKEISGGNVAETPPVTPSKENTEPAPVEEKPEFPVAPPVVEKPVKLVTPEPAPQTTESGGEGRGLSHVLAWVVGGVGVAALATGIIMNIVARNDMDTCNSKFNVKLYADARAACNSAKPAAYTSYAMFGVAGAAAAAEGIIFYSIFWSGNGDSSADTSLSLGWLPGGLSLSARGRF
jgi:hypothetical protein